MALDNKYGKVMVEKTPGNPLGEYEPVVVFRARDIYLPDVLEHYTDLCAGDSPDSHLDSINAALERVIDWQTDNPDLVKVPD